MTMTNDEMEETDAEELWAEELRALRETTRRQTAQIRSQIEAIRRLQTDLTELPAIREYLKSLIPLHRACGQLVEEIYKRHSGKDDALRKQAEAVEKLLKALGQR